MDKRAHPFLIYMICQIFIFIVSFILWLVGKEYAPSVFLIANGVNYLWFILDYGKGR